VAGRNLRSLWRTPQALVFATVQPAIFVLLFRYAFGGAIHVAGVSYVDYLMPGIFAQAVAFGAIGTAVGPAADLRPGILVRFRTLPMSRSAALGGRTLADLARNIAVVAVMTGVGFRTKGDPAALLAALGLVAVFAYALSWVFVALGLRVSDPEAAQVAGVPVMFLLVFTSDAFVPLRSMPGWLQAAGGAPAGHGPGRCRAGPHPRRPGGQRRPRLPGLECRDPPPLLRPCSARLPAHGPLTGSDLT
jgi:ABC-2 type transport system permease protein/oleandomycin transport system permease protein